MKVKVPLLVLCAKCVLMFCSAPAVFANDAGGDAGNSDQDLWMPPNTNTNKRMLHTFQVKSALEESGLLTNVTDVRLDGVTTSTTGNVVTVHNLRAVSDTTDFNDYLSVDLLFDIENLRFVVTDIDITENLGVYYRAEGLFAKDVPTEITMTTPSGRTLDADTSYNITATVDDEFTMILEAGHKIGYRTENPSDDYRLRLTNPDGKRVSNAYYAADSHWCSYITILQSGVYTFQFIPEHHDSVSVTFSFSNANPSTIKTIGSGDRIAASLNRDGEEYRKYRLELNAGDLVKLTGSADSNIDTWLIDQNSRNIASVGSGGQLEKPVSYPGTYYLFVVKDHSCTDESFSMDVTITSDPDTYLYPNLSMVPNQTATINQSFQLQLIADNAPTEYWTTGLPGNLSIDSDTGLISGTPNVSGTFPIRVGVTNEYGSDRQNFTLSIGPQDVHSATTLITHYYTSILRRGPEPDGLTYWQNLIAEKQAQGLDVKPVFRDMATFFFNSDEYLGRNTTDDEFITNLYLTFFQREPDQSGITFWLGQLANSVTRNEAMAGFLYAPEFTSFMENLGF